MFHISLRGLLFFLAILMITALPSLSWALPKGFASLNHIDPHIIQDIKYATSDNFIGRPVKGYSSKSTCILTIPAVHALVRAQELLKPHKLKLKVFDCYRPTDSVDDFMAWSRDANDQKMKVFYYPNVNKADFFSLGYIAEKSGHSRGNTVDLTLIHELSGQEVDMGTPFDFMDPLSHSDSQDVSSEARANREILKEVMMQASFLPYLQEWWHFTLKDEPFPDTYFNFPTEDFLIIS
jgi:D-alanyl-D-alanine dipeptidase